MHVIIVYRIHACLFFLLFLKGKVETRGLAFFTGAKPTVGFPSGLCVHAGRGQVGKSVDRRLGEAGVQERSPYADFCLSEWERENY